MAKEKPSFRCRIGERVLDVRASSPFGAAIHAANKAGFLDEEVEVAVDIPDKDPQTFSVLGRPKKGQPAAKKGPLY